MRKKFLSLALITAAVALLIMPGVFADTSGSPEALVDVQQDETFSIALLGDMESSTFTVSTAKSTPTDTVSTTYAASDFVKVVDYTGSASGYDGHRFSISFDRGTWTYSGAETGGNSVVVDTNATAGDDELMFRVYANTGAFNFSEKDPDVCTGDTNNMSLSTVIVTTADKVLGRSTDTCAGKSYYTPDYLEIQGPLNGLQVGKYTISGTVTLTDGQS